MAYAFQVTFDAADPGRARRILEAGLGLHRGTVARRVVVLGGLGPREGHPRGRWNDQSAIVDPDGAGPRVFFQRVPEGKAAKNRVHLDVRAAPGLDPDARRARLTEESERLIGLGATKLYEFEERGSFWITMQDPEGNEFCLD